MIGTDDRRDMMSSIGDHDEDHDASTTVLVDLIITVLVRIGVINVGKEFVADILVAFGTEYRSPIYSAGRYSLS